MSRQRPNMEKESSGQGSARAENPAVEFSGCSSESCMSSKVVEYSRWRSSHLSREESRDPESLPNATREEAESHPRTARSQDSDHAV